MVYSLYVLALRREADAFGWIKSMDLERRCHKGYLFVQTIEKIINRKVIQTAKKLFFESSPLAMVGNKDNILTEQ